jgi:hypothetical protein
MKTIAKRKLNSLELIEAVKREKIIHSKVNSRFCIQLLASFSESRYLHFILEWAPSSLDKLMGFQRVLLNLKFEN